MVGRAKAKEGDELAEAVGGVLAEAFFAVATESREGETDILTFETTLGIIEIRVLDALISAV